MSALVTLIGPILRTLLIMVGSGSVASQLVTPDNIQTMLTSLPVIIGAVTLLVSFIWSIVKNVKAGISQSGSIWRFIVQTISSGSIVAVFLTGFNPTDLISAGTTFISAIGSIIAIVSQIKSAKKVEANSTTTEVK